MVTSEMRETAWVIERHFHSVLHYWNGKPARDSKGIAWTTDHNDAMRFARRQDAEAMLTWHCDGIGNVVEHIWDA